MYKCRFCSKVLSPKNSHKVTDDKGKHAYYCSADEYAMGMDTIGLLHTMCGDITKTQTDKITKEWFTTVGVHMVYGYLLREQNNLQRYLQNKTNPYLKLRYISAVIRNNLYTAADNDEVTVAPACCMEMYEIKQTMTPKRICFADLEDEI